MHGAKRDGEGYLRGRVIRGGCCCGTATYRTGRQAKKSAAVLRRYYNSQTLEHIEGLHLCVLPLANERQYDIDGLFLGLAVHRDDQVVITSVVA